MWKVDGLELARRQAGGLECGRWQDGWLKDSVGASEALKSELVESKKFVKAAWAEVASLKTEMTHVDSEKMEPNKEFEEDREKSM